MATDTDIPGNGEAGWIYLCRLVSGSGRYDKPGYHLYSKVEPEFCRFRIHEFRRTGICPESGSGSLPKTPETRDPIDLLKKFVLMIGSLALVLSTWSQLRKRRE